MFLFLIAIIACADVSENGNNGGCVENCGTVDPASEAELVVTASFLGVAENSDVVIDNEIAGSTGETITISDGIPTEVEVGILDGPTTTDGIPLHMLGPSWNETVWEGSSVVAPKQTVTGNLAEPQTVTAGFNLWRPDEYWTCDEVRSWEDGVHPGTPAMTAYTGGSSFHMPGVGVMVIDGVELSIEDHTSGEFTSPITATVVAVQDEAGEFYVTSTCFTSDGNGNKVDADGNIVSE
ncbi:MAG: hypothetical protein AAB473_04930 [Patescibacteria group bacterium]